MLLLLLLRALTNDMRGGLLGARCEADIHIKCVVAVIFFGAVVLIIIMLIVLLFSIVKATGFII